MEQAPYAEGGGPAGRQHRYRGYVKVDPDARPPTSSAPPDPPPTGDEQDEPQPEDHRDTPRWRRWLSRDT